MRRVLKNRRGMMRETLVKWYLEYVNDFITVERFAEYHGITQDQALVVIQLGKTLNETPHPDA